MVLVTSSQTGFDIDYLVELAARIQISSLTFEGYFFYTLFNTAPNLHGDPLFFKMGTQFIVKWGPNGDPRQQNGDPKSACLQN